MADHPSQSIANSQTTPELGSDAAIPILVAEVFEEAFGALGRPCHAQFASMPDDLMGKQNPLLSRNHLHKVLFNLFGIVVLGEFQATRNAVNVRVHHHTVGDFEPCAKNHVCRLACDAGQSE